MDRKGAIESSPVVFPGNGRGQFDEFMLRKTKAKTRVQIVGDIRRRARRATASRNASFSYSSKCALVSNRERSLSCSSVIPAFLLTAEWMSIQNGQPTMAATLSWTSSLTFCETTPAAAVCLLIRSDSWSSFGSRARTRVESGMWPNRRFTCQKTSLVQNRAS